MDSVRRSFIACCWDTQARSPCVVKDQITKFVYDLTQMKPTIKELKKKKKVLSCICMFITRGSQARKYAQSKSTYKWRDVTLI